MLIEFDVTGRRRTLTGDDLARVRLGYAQHIHRAQGATVTRTLVVTGGWQTSKEPAYVEASRARQGTDWFVSREDLGVEGHDTDRIQRLAENMRRSHAQTPSLAHPELPDRDYGPNFHRHDRAEPHQPAYRGSPAPSTASSNPPSTGANTMSQRVQVVLSDPVAAQLRELAARRRHTTLHARRTVRRQRNRPRRQERPRSSAALSPRARRRQQRRATALA